MIFEAVFLMEIKKCSLMDKDFRYCLLCGDILSSYRRVYLDHTHTYAHAHTQTFLVSSKLQAS